MIRSRKTGVRKSERILNSFGLSNLPTVNHRSIVVQPMNGLRRNDGAMKN
jgi:hypothetical protein